MKSYFYNLPGWAKVILSLLFAVFIFLVFNILGIVLAYLFFPSGSVSIDALTNVSRTDNIGLLKYAQAIQSLGLFVLPPFAIAWLFSSSIKEYLFLNKSAKLSSYLLIVITIFSIQPIINSLVTWNAMVELPEYLAEQEALAEQLMIRFLDAHTLPALLTNILVMALIPAIGEELIFRGLIQSGLARSFKNHHLAILLTAILFSAIHMQFSGFLPRMFMGVFLGYLLVWSRSLWLPILAHFLNNSAAVLSFYFGEGKQDVLAQKIEAANQPIIMLVFGVALTSAILYVIYTTEKNKNSKNI